jgi:hypothetical protein
VFVDQQEACECTRKRIDASWSELEKALGTPPSLPVERLFLDTQADQVEPYMLIERLMVPPGIYFLDEHDGVVQMLQGEVQRSQIDALLAARQP